MKILYLLKSSIEQITKNKFIHIILIIAVMVSTAVLNYVSSVVNMAIYDTAIIESFRDREVFFVSADAYRINDGKGSANQPVVLEKYEEMQQNEHISVGLIKKDQIQINDKITDIYDILVHGDIIKNNLSFSLKAGRQLHQYTGDAVPIILTDNHPLLKTYKIGDKLSATVAFSDSFEDATSGVPAKKETVIFEICGIMKKPYRYYRDPIQYSITASNVLNQELDPMIFSSDWITSTGEYASNRWNKVVSHSEWIADITIPVGSAEYIEAYTYLTENFEVVPYKNFLDMSRNNFKQGLADPVYILICVVGLIAVAIGSANIYIGKKQIRSFAINFISGAKWSDCVFIEIFRNIIVIIIPTVISGIASGIYLSSQLPEYYDSGMAVDPLSVIFIVLLMTVLFLISSMPYILKLKRTEPLTFIRTMNRE